MSAAETQFQKEEKQGKRLRKVWAAVSRAAARKARKRMNKKPERRKRLSKTEKEEQERQELIEEFLVDEGTPAPLEESDRESEISKLVFLKRLLKKSEKRAQIANYRFEIDIKWLVDRVEAKNCCCEICGGVLEFKSRVKGNEFQRLFREFPWNISLDQRTHGAGYTRDNVQISHVTCNLSKLDMEMHDFLELCAKIVDFNRNRV